MQFRHSLTALSLALATALPLFLPHTAVAQTTGTVAQRAAITSFQAQPAERLRPGEVLTFEVQGTPGGEVSVRIDGTNAPAVLNETRSGVYSGDYTIRQQDRLTARSSATARIVSNGYWAEVPLRQSLLAGAQLQDPQNTRQDTRQDNNNNVARNGTQITDFGIDSPDRARPGDELTFTLRGTPRGQASVALQGVDKRIPLRETSPGMYQASYVLRRSDRMRGEPVAEAYLVSNRREATWRYDARQAGQGSAEPRQAQAQTLASCATCGRIDSVNRVEAPNDSKNIIGSVAGGVLGGVLGHQVGGGTGKDLATVLGAVGGAYAGNRIQNNAEKTYVYRVAVRMDSKELQTFDYADDPKAQVGTLVRVENGVLIKR